MNSVWTSLYQTEFELKYYNVNGIKTRCLEAGSGEPIIFLHGVGGHLEAYCRNIKSHVENGFKVFAIDMIGHGFTDKVTDRDIILPDYTKHLIDFMDLVGLSKPSISGESLGGWVAAWFAAEYPDRVKKLVLNTAGGLTAYPEVMKKLKTLTMDAVKNATYDIVKKRLEFLMHDPSFVTDELVEIRRTIYQQPNMVEGMERIMCLQELEIRQQNMLTEEQLKSIQAPACVIWTSHDPTAASEVGQKFASLIPNCEFNLIENSGHWPQYESYEEFNRIHIEFLKK